MDQLRLSRRDILKGAAAAGGLAAAGSLLGPLAALADDEPADDALGAFGPWSNVHQIEELASIYGDYHPAISRNGRSLYFTTDRIGLKEIQIWVSHRDDDQAPWGPPAPVDALNAPGFNTAVPNLEPNGHVIYFNSNRPGGAGAGDIYVSSREHAKDDFDWETPVQIGGDVNTADSESGPTYFEARGQARLYFCRFHGLGSIGEQSQDWNIYVSLQAEGDTFGPGQIVTNLNSPFAAPWSRDTRTAIRRDGLELFVTSNRHAGQVKPTENIWVFTRTDPTDDFNWEMLPNQPDANLNSGLGDGGPALSADGTTLYFFSQRAGLGLPGKRQLWMATRERR